MEEQNLTPPPEGIAVIGMSGRFPGASNVEQFWQNLVAGVESISQFSENELEYSVATPEAIADGQKFVGARGVLEGVDQFDAEFFNMYPKEAQITDPQHRLFLECAWEAVESAGYNPHAYEGLIGLYAGLAMNTYFLHNLCTGRDFVADFSGNYQVGGYQTMLGNDKDFMPTRVSYKLNLRGPSMSVQCACSTSLVAVCQACTSLLTYQCDMALAGGASITFPQKRDYRYQEDAIVAADGRCRTFDADACGTVFGHGVAVVLLKRLEDAIADRDPILGVIKGFALNNDGHDKIGYAAPSVNAQADVIAMAQASAGIHPDTISYVEAHGTATPLGDPIEVAGLSAAFRRGGATRNNYCALGTCKTNIGHLDVAAGATGLIKTILQLQNGLIPPILHFKAPNPKIDFANSPFFPASKPIDWKPGEAPRRAGVSAFGIGGTNAHVVVEEAPSTSSSSSTRKTQLLLLSARTSTALQNMSMRLADHLEAHPDAALADVAFTLQRGRQRFQHRLAVTADSTTDAIERLRSTRSAARTTGVAPAESRSLVFLFPGQGSQYVDMGRSLYETEPVFKQAVDCCAECLQSHLQFDIRMVLYPDAAGRKLAEAQINETRATQPILFTIEYALALLWMSWGIEPSLLIGHSVGEYVAAVLAEVFNLEDALALLATRAKLMQSVEPGSMLAVRRSLQEIEPMLPEGVEVAAINGPVLLTLSGPTPMLKSFQEKLKGDGIACRLLATSHAFHSSMMDPIISPFSKFAKTVLQRQPKLPWISTFTGTLMSESEALDSTYWAQQLRHTVRFGQAVETAIQRGATTFLEVGPGQALTQLVLQQATKPKDLTVLPSLNIANSDRSELDTLLSSLGRIWTLGIEPEWSEFYSRETRQRVTLPTYPFERKSYWVAPPAIDKSKSTEKATPAATQSMPASNQPSTALKSTDEATASGAPQADGTTSLDARRVMEMQIQIMAQQLETIRKRAAAGRSNDGQ
jgi:acyl transferase domain-containing protein